MEVAAATPEVSSPPPAGAVARASFTSQVVDREPQDTVTSLPSYESQILFFTELNGFTDQTLTHVWELEGTEMARVPFAVHYRFDDADRTIFS